jgi:L-lactate dehydrogenase complex protein LldF
MSSLPAVKRSLFSPSYRISRGLARPGRFAAAQRASQLGRPLGRRRGWIGQLPPPLAAWTRARDLPVPPAQTFRQWWRDEHEKPS